MTVVDVSNKLQQKCLQIQKNTRAFVEKTYAKANKALQKLQHALNNLEPHNGR